MQKYIALILMMGFIATNADARTAAPASGLTTVTYTCPATQTVNYTLVAPSGATQGSYSGSITAHLNAFTCPSYPNQGLQCSYSHPIFGAKWMGRNIEDLNWEDHPIPKRTPAEIKVIMDDIARIQYTFGDRGVDATRKRFVCKYPVFQTEISTLQELFPDAHFIHIVRDGRMVANSLVKLNRLVNDQIKKIKHPMMNSLVPYPRVRNLEKYLKEWGAEDVRTTAHIWKDSIELVKNIAPTLKNFHEVRYEDLMKDPRGKMEALLKKLNLKIPATTDQAYQTEISSWGKMHHQNKYGEFQVIEEIAGDLLKSYGY